MVNARIFSVRVGREQQLVKRNLLKKLKKSDLAEKLDEEMCLLGISGLPYLHSL